jgi:hypothetical protein
MLMRLAAETLCDLRTVTRAYDAKPITSASRSAIRQAAERLGYPMPPEPNPSAPAGE